MTLLFAAAVCGTVSLCLAEDGAIPLHTAVGDTLDAGESARFEILDDVEGLRDVVFTHAPWGGYLARIRVQTAKGPVLRERNVSSATWADWRQRVDDILAGRLPPAGEPQPTPVDSVTFFATVPPDTLREPPEEQPTRLRVWPEAPLPAGLPRAVRIDSAEIGYPKMSGRWFILLEAGYKRNLSDFREYFTDQGLLAVSWGRMYGRLMPIFSIEVGFGDIKKQMEEISGDGGANTYIFSFGLLLRQPLSERTQIYASAAFGYHIRSLNWGGLFINPQRGTVSNGYVLEQQNWGQAYRFGVQLLRKGQKKPRFWDIGVGLQTSRADAWNYVDDLDNPSIFLSADERDTWVTLSVRYGDAI